MSIEGWIYRAIALALLLAVLPAVAQQEPDKTQRTTGSGGHFLKYSSTQVTAELAPEQATQLALLQSRRCGAHRTNALVNASAASLSALKFSPIEVTADVGLVKGEHDEILISHAHEVLRGVLKMKVPFLPSKPDHQSTQALVIVHPDLAGDIVHLELIRTIWDSGGNAKTAMLTDPASYQQFFARLERDGDCGEIVNARTIRLADPASANLAKSPAWADDAPVTARQGK